MIFRKEYLVGELDLPDAAIEDKIIDTTRWSVSHHIIFKVENKYYSAIYSEGATEMQDERPWEDCDAISCSEVHQEEVIIKRWVAVK